MNILQAMLVRRSVRTFERKPVPAQLLEIAKGAFDNADRISDIPLRLMLVPAAQVAHAMTGLVGSYGSMKNPPVYAIGISQEGEHDQINFGFVMEQFILACTEGGLGTCWVGGFFKKSRMDQAIPLEAGERIICVSPVGYPDERRLAERAMRTVGRLNSRKPLSELVFAGRWGRPATEYLVTRPALFRVFEAARWAPSGSNGQPVRYVVDDERIVVCLPPSSASRYLNLLGADRAEGLDFRRVDAGIAMAHVHLAARHLGIAGSLSLAFDEAVLREQHAVPDGVRIVGVFGFDRSPG